MEPLEGYDPQHIFFQYGVCQGMLVRSLALTSRSASHHALYFEVIKPDFLVSHFFTITKNKA